VFIEKLKKINKMEKRYQGNDIHLVLKHEQEPIIPISQLFNTPIFSIQQGESDYKYITCSYQTFFETYYNQCQCPLYIHEKFNENPTKLYLDIECKIPPPSTLKTTEIIPYREVVVEMLKNHFVEGTYYILDATRDDYFSHHIIFDESVVLFDSPITVGEYVKAVIDQMKTSSTGNVKKYESWNWIDVGIYSMYKSLRCCFSYKMEKNRPVYQLLPTLSLANVDRIECLKKTLIQYVPLSSPNLSHIIQGRYTHPSAKNHLFTSTVTCQNQNSFMKDENNIKMQNYKWNDEEITCLRTIMREYKKEIETKFEGIHIEPKIFAMRRGRGCIILSVSGLTCERKLYTNEVRHRLQRGEIDVKGKQYFILYSYGVYHQRCFRCDKIPSSDNKDLPEDLHGKEVLDHVIKKEYINTLF
jgi:hypothetical protein